MITDPGRDPGSDAGPVPDPTPATGTHRARTVCPCGWVATLTAADEAQAALAAARARAAHRADAHAPRRIAGWWRRTGLSPRAHECHVGPTSHAGTGFRCAVACSCGWVRECRSAERATLLTGAEREHRRHVTIATGRTPRRDYLVLVAIVLALTGLAIASVNLVVDLAR